MARRGSAGHGDPLNSRVRGAPLGVAPALAPPGSPRAEWRRSKHGSWRALAGPWIGPGPVTVMSSSSSPKPNFSLKFIPASSTDRLTDPHIYTRARAHHTYTHTHTHSHPQTHVECTRGFERNGAGLCWRRTVAPRPRRETHFSYLLFLRKRANATNEGSLEPSQPMASRPGAIRLVSTAMGHGGHG